MIRRFTIRGFKRFEHQTKIDLDAVTVLVGANNSGKSTILEALTLFQYCLETTRRANGKAGGKRQSSLSSRSVSPDEFGVLPVAEPTDLWPNGRTTGSKTIELQGEYDNGAEIGFTLKLSYNRFSITPKLSGDTATAIRQQDIRLIPIFSGFIPREEYLTPPARQERMRLQRHGETVRNLLWDLREHHESRWDKLVDLLHYLFPESVLHINFDVEIDRFSTRPIETVCSPASSTSWLRARDFIRHCRSWFRCSLPAPVPSCSTNRTLISMLVCRLSSWESWNGWPARNLRNSSSRRTRHSF